MLATPTSQHACRLLQIGGWIYRIGVTARARKRVFGLIGLAVVGVLIGSAAGPFASAATAGLALTLNGQLLTLSSSDPSVLGAVQGSSGLYVVCDTAVGNAAKPWPSEDISVGNTVSWPANATSTQTDIPPGLPSGPAQCQLWVRNPFIVFSAGVTVRAPAPTAARRSARAEDLRHTRFAIAGKRLTVTTTDPNLLRLIRGERVVAECMAGDSTSLALGYQNAPAYSGDVANAVTWGRHAKAVRVTFLMDLSGRIDNCTLSRISAQMATLTMRVVCGIGRVRDCLDVDGRECCDEGVGIPGEEPNQGARLGDVVDVV